MAGTSTVSGLASGINWSNIIDQLRAVEQRKITLLTNQKQTEQNKLSAWQSINSRFLSLKAAADELNQSDGFNLYQATLSSNTTKAAEDILSVATGTSAAPGTYKIIVNSLASAQKLSSTSYATQDESLNLSGDIIVGGRTVKIAASDNLGNIRDKINQGNSGTGASKVTASIVNYGTSGYRLILTSDTEGEGGINLLNGGASNLVGGMGFFDASAKTAKNVITGGNKSDLFAYADKAVGGSDLLNLTSASSGAVTITINGTSKSVAINLATDSLNTIRDAINTAFSGVFPSNPAAVVTETVDDTTEHRLLIEGTTVSYTDANNVLETLGILKQAGISAERGMTGGTANTSAGAAITSSTRFDQIDGYLDYAAGDTLNLTGTDTSGNPVSSAFSLYDSGTGAYKTVGDLLNEIQTRYGSATASVTADGRIQIVDNEIGDTHLAVVLTPSKASLKFDPDGNFGAIGTIRSRQIQAGANAEISVDGITLTPTSNSPDDIIPGVTLNLKEEAEETTLTLTVGRDLSAVKEKISGFISAYNDVMTAINGQRTYDEQKKQPGGPLYGDSTLRLLRANLTHIIVNRVAGVSANYSSLGMIGISLDKDGKLTTDDSKLQGFLETNFDDVRKLFAADWSSTNGNLTYVAHSINTKAGTHNLHIEGVDPVNGYFASPGDASGNGEFLTGTAGDAKGLLVRYSGAATGAVGSMTLTFGVAELFDRMLYQVTDDTWGYLPLQEQTIQDAMARYDKEISTRQAEIDRRMEDLQNRFVAMETVLSQLQSQSNWLTGQVSAAAAGWK